MRVGTAVAASLVMFLPGALVAQHGPVPIAGTELRPLHSRVLDRDMELYVKLPRSYGTGQRTYPVLFTTDGNRSFPLYAANSFVYETPGMGNPEMVIVGIGYRVDDDPMLALVDWAVWRTRDLTPARRPAVEASWTTRLSVEAPEWKGVVRTGGAPAFLQFIQTEVIPFIEANYRVSHGDRGLAGYSYGGLFTLYALFHSPETFSRYFAGDPSMWNEVFDDEAAYAASHDDLPARVAFVTMGQREAVQRLLDQLQERGYPGLDLRVGVIEGEAHAAGMPAAISRGLQLLYDLK